MTIYQSNTSAASSGVGNAASSWLRGWWLLAVQGAWAVLTLSCVGLFLAGIPSRYSQLIHVSAALRTTLAQLGLSASSYAIGTLGSDALYLLGSVVIAGLILRHRSYDAMGLFVCVFLVSFAGASSASF